MTLCCAWNQRVAMQSEPRQLNALWIIAMSITMSCYRYPWRAGTPHAQGSRGSRRAVGLVCTGAKGRATERSLSCAATPQHQYPPKDWGFSVVRRPTCSVLSLLFLGVFFSAPGCCLSPCTTRTAAAGRHALLVALVDAACHHVLLEMHGCDGCAHLIRTLLCVCPHTHPPTHPHTVT